MFKAVFHRVAPVLIICSMLASALGVVVSTTGAKADYPGGDCDANAVIRCGVNSIGELKDDYRANQGGNVQAAFAEFHMPNEAAFDGMVPGRVTKTGEIWVGDKMVATGAVTAGRQNMPGSTPILGGQFYARSPGVSFRSDSLEALVKMNGETFHTAVIMSCGNPVNAFPTVTPAPAPQPQPKPQPQPQKPDLSIQKDVRVLGTSAWQQEVTADPNDQLQFMITVKNTSDVDLKNVTIHDSLPSGVSFEDANLEGSEEVRGFKISDLVGDGIEVEALKKGALIQVDFVVQIGDQVDACEEPLRNIAHASADDVAEKQDDALAKVCQPEKPEEPEKPVPPQVQSKQTPPTLPETGAGVLGIFSATSILGAALFRLKEFYARFL